MLRAAIGWAEDLHPSAAITSFADERLGRFLKRKEAVGHRFLVQNMIKYA